MAQQVTVWVARVLWLILPFTAGPAFGDALAPHSAALRLLAEAGLWALWAIALAASLVPRSSSLTVCRTVAPGAVAVAVWAVASGVDAAAAALAVATCVLAAGALYLPAVGEAFVDGSSYGDERRFTLRLPPALALGLLPLTWAVLAAATVAGPLLLAARQWVAGGILVAVGVPVAVVCAKRLHVLARRWVVLVPAGFVLHDPLALDDAALIPKAMLAGLGPAPADFAGLDLSLAALGLAVEARFTEPVEFALPVRRDGKARLTSSERIAFTPTRPAALLAAARERRLPVG